MNDSITKLDIDILNMESAELEGSELGSIKYISEISGWDVKKVGAAIVAAAAAWWVWIHDSVSSLMSGM